MKKTEQKKVLILGSEWTIIFKDEDPAFEKSKGYTDEILRTIVIENEKVSDNPMDYNLQAQYLDKQRVMRHEVVHAYLFEAGLGESSCGVDAWAVNEEMVDWFARMGQRIMKTWEEIGAVDDPAS